MHVNSWRNFSFIFSCSKPLHFEAYNHDNQKFCTHCLYVKWFLQNHKLQYLVTKGHTCQSTKGQALIKPFHSQTWTRSICTFNAITPPPSTLKCLLPLLFLPYVQDCLDDATSWCLHRQTQGTSRVAPSILIYTDWQQHFGENFFLQVSDSG